MSHEVRCGDLEAHSISCCNATTQLPKTPVNLSLTVRGMGDGAPSCIHKKR